ncbi:MAG: MBL fold metallo-hydrolase [Clostridia bacterium]|nr:MBL fold metallo-hydrolase [Clostridia bacterium]
MKLQYLGHSSFRIISDMGMTVVTDPYKSDMVGLQMPQVRCDVVTMSHHHADHDCTESILGHPTEIDVCGACAADDVAINSFETFHDDKKGSLRGKNLVFTFLVDGLKIAHLGDIGCLDEKVAQSLVGCDLLLVPVGGTYTVDHIGAKWYVDKINPKIVIPMHYKCGTSTIDISPVDDFLSLFDQQQIRHVGDTLNLFDTPENETPLVYVMDMWE